MQIYKKTSKDNLLRQEYNINTYNSIQTIINRKYMIQYYFMIEHTIINRKYTIQYCFMIDFIA